MEKGGRVTGDALSAHSIGATVKRYAEKAGYKPEDLGGAFPPGGTRNVRRREGSLNLSDRYPCGIIA